MNGVFVFAQQVDGKVANVSLELIGEGKRLADKLGTNVTAVVLGVKLAEIAKELCEYGADRVICVENPKLEVYMNEPYAHTVADIIKEYMPDIFLFGATAIGRDLAPRVSARVHTGLTADCTVLEITDEKEFYMTRPAFGGNIMATISCPDHRPQMATVRPGVMAMLERKPGRTAEIINKSVDIPDSAMNVEIMEIVKNISSNVDITQAKILVSGGRGVGGPEGFKVLEQVAQELGGVVSGSRATVDAGWIAKDLQVGQTGKTVRPELYIACGISGAIQHLAGMEGSEIIIAINTDETAPIFEVATYGIVGDLFKILPKLTELLKKEMAGV